jgi:phosphoserine aminotransferase
MERVHNFNAGPAVLPEEVLREAQQDLFNYKGMGLSVMEMSHRSKEYEAIINETRAAAKRIYNLGDDWEVLFLQGGASLQFLMVPMSFAQEGKPANYINTGQWSKKAISEAKKIGKSVHVAATSEDRNFCYIPKSWTLSDNPSYLHITTNNTIFGTEWKTDPDVPAGVPLIADMSSNFMSKPIDVEKYSMIYAGAQKNVGPSGTVVVLIKKDFLATAASGLPTMLDYQIHAQKREYVQYSCHLYDLYDWLVLKWIENYGGLAKIEENISPKLHISTTPSMLQTGSTRNRGQSRPLSDEHHFQTSSEELEALFISEAKSRYDRFEGSSRRWRLPRFYL